MRPSAPATPCAALAPNPAIWRARAPRWLGLLGAVALVGGCVSAPQKSAPTPATVAPASPNSSTTSTSTTTTLPDRLAAGIDPGDVVATVDLERSDIDGGAVKLDDGRDDVRSADACKAISHSPFLASHTSPKFSNGQSFDIWFASQVAVEPTSSAASAVVDHMSSEAWAQHCDLPHNSAVLQKEVDNENAATGCDFAITGASEKAIDASSLPEDVVGWRYRATVHCSVSGADLVIYNDLLVTSVGPVVISLNLQTGDTPPTDIDHHVIAVLTDRAKAALAP